MKKKEINANFALTKKKLVTLLNKIEYYDN